MPECPGCGVIHNTGGAWNPWCGDCAAGMTPWPDACPQCGDIQPETALCPSCTRSPTLRDRTIHALAYGEIIRTMVGKYKYSGWYPLAFPFALLIATRLTNLYPDYMDAPIIPVPAHPIRRITRRFDSTAHLARVVGRLTGHPVSEKLRRLHHDTPQASLPSSERRRLAASRFRLTGRTIPGRGILLDDVFTTGSTVRACVTALRSAGMRTVAVLTLARVP